MNDRDFRKLLEVVRSRSTTLTEISEAVADVLEILWDQNYELRERIAILEGTR